MKVSWFKYSPKGYRAFLLRCIPGHQVLLLRASVDPGLSYQVLATGFAKERAGVQGCAVISFHWGGKHGCDKVRQEGGFEIKVPVFFPRIFSRTLIGFSLNFSLSQHIVSPYFRETSVFVTKVPTEGSFVFWLSPHQVVFKHLFGFIWLINLQVSDH